MKLEDIFLNRDVPAVPVLFKIRFAPPQMNVCLVLALAAPLSSIIENSIFTSREEYRDQRNCLIIDVIEQSRESLSFAIEIFA